MIGNRLDFVVMDAWGYPVLAVAYQGRGHHRGHAVQCDAVKRAGLERAGIVLLESPADDDPVKVEGAIGAGLGEGRRQSGAGRGL